MESFLVKTDVWNKILEDVSEHLNEHIFESWFRPIRFDGLDEKNRTLHLRAGQFTKDWVAQYYTGLIKQCLDAQGKRNFEIAWAIDEERPSKTLFEETGNNETTADEPDELRFEHSRTAVPPIVAGTTNFVDIEPVENSLNPKYTFEKFVVGNSNQFAHAAAVGAAETPGKTYNPLFIYGGTGLGKTHLMHAIGHQIKKQNRHMRVAYITSEKFMNELINAIRYDKTHSFREKYRSIDVLLMDDVQFFAGKERTQEEFFHTFNTLHNNQKQIVISSDCPPREIPTLEERLHSRFEWGLIADIEPPDLETKVAILKRKADLDGIDLDDDIAIFIASKVKSNIRELEGSLTRLLAISSLRGIPISKMLVQEALKNIIDSDRPEGLTMERIIRMVGSHFKLTVDEIKSKNNSRAISFPRQVAMYLCKRLTKHSFPEIGREFGGKHHTTVMHSCEKIEQMIKDDRVFHNQVNELIEHICS